MSNFPQRVNTTPRPYNDQMYAGVPQMLLEYAEIEFDRTGHYCYHTDGQYHTLCGLSTPHNTRNRGNLLWCPPCNQRLMRLAGVALHSELARRPTPPPAAGPGTVTEDDTK